MVLVDDKQLVEDYVLPDGSREFAADQGFGNNKIKNIKDPEVDQDGVNKRHMDNSFQSRDFKESVRAASDGNAIPGAVYNATGGPTSRGQLTSMPTTLDGVSLQAGDRILPKDEATGVGADANGIYDIITLGTGSDGVWDRARDFRKEKDVRDTACAFCFVEEGIVNADKGFLLTTNSPITIGGASGTALTWEQFTKPDPQQLLDVKVSVRAATTSSIADLSAASVTRDGVTLVQGDRLLVKDGASPDGIITVSDIFNGIYTVGVVTGGTAPFTRSTDFDTSAEVTPNAFTFVEEGTVNADSGFVLITNAPITLDTTALVWTQFTGGGGAGSKAALQNKAQTATTTTSDGDQAASVTMAVVPFEGGYVEVFVNGVQYEVGNGVKTKDCYFSADAGATARSISDIAAGDTLHWNGSVIGFQLATTDRIDFKYHIAA